MNIFSTVFTITDNSFIKFLSCVFLFAAGAYFIYSVCAGRSDVERYLPYAMKKSLLVQFDNISSLLRLFLT